MVLIKHKNIDFSFDTKFDVLLWTSPVSAHGAFFYMEMPGLIHSKGTHLRKDPICPYAFYVVITFIFAPNEL